MRRESGGHRTGSQCRSAASANDGNSGFPSLIRPFGGEVDGGAIKIVETCRLSAVRQAVPACRMPKPAMKENPYDSRQKEFGFTSMPR